MISCVFCEFFIFVLVVEAQQPENDPSVEVERLVRKWSPLIWLSPGEIFFPSEVDDFLENVVVAGKNGSLISNSLNVEFPNIHNTKSHFLTTKLDLKTIVDDPSSFIYGKNPQNNSIPTYALISSCSNPKSDQKLSFHVTYWFFYPYNRGKEVCFFGNMPSPLIFGRCFGRLRTMGNHVGDWEHMSLSFRGNPYPEEMLLAVHDWGIYYKYDELKKLFRYKTHVALKGIVQGAKFPPIVRLSGGHPVVFAANGSHGLWGAPGEHQYFKVPKLSDSNGYGVPWKTWNELRVLRLGEDKEPDWVNFKGRWGNPKGNCLLLQKLGLCELVDGPAGILTRKQDFYC